MSNLHAIEVKYHGPTNYKGSRVSLKSLRFSGPDFNGVCHADKVTINYDHSKNSIADMAVDWLEGHGYTIVAKAESITSYIVLVEQFCELKAAKDGALLKAVQS